MGLMELLLIAVGLSMDAFAVSVCHGMRMQKVSMKKALVVGLYFGGFQALMPLLGYLLGAQFASYITAFDHWIAFVLLLLIGGKMVWESRGAEQDCDAGAGEADLSPKKMLPLAVATSIDALAVGISLAFLNVRIAPSAALIGVITLVLSMVGVKLGHVFGARFKSRAELAGGIILILIGTKILLEHLGILG